MKRIHCIERAPCYGYHQISMKAHYSCTYLILFIFLTVISSCQILGGEDGEDSFCDLSGPTPSTADWQITQYPFNIQSLVLDSDTLFLFTNEGIIKSTFDESFSQQVYSFGSDGEVISATFLQQTIWAGLLDGNGTRVIKSTDNGNSWAPVDTIANRWFRKIRFVNQNRGFASAEVSGSPSLELYVTTDGGNEWNRIDPLLADEELFQMIDEDTGYFVSDSRQLEKTDDGFQSLNTVTGPGRVITSFYFLDAQAGYATYVETSDPSIGGVIKTTDGGNSWETVSTSVSRIVHFSDQQNGLVVRDIRRCFVRSDGVERTLTGLFQTTDGGETWTGSENEGLYAFSRVQRFSNDRIFVRFRMNFQTLPLVGIEFNP